MIEFILCCMLILFTACGGFDLIGPWIVLGIMLIGFAGFVAVFLMPILVMLGKI